MSFEVNIGLLSRLCLVGSKEILPSSFISLEFKGLFWNIWVHEQQKPRQHSSQNSSTWVDWKFSFPRKSIVIRLVRFPLTYFPGLINLIQLMCSWLRPANSHTLCVACWGAFLCCLHETKPTFCQVQNVCQSSPTKRKKKKRWKGVSFTLGLDVVRAVELSWGFLLLPFSLVHGLP